MAKGRAENKTPSDTAIVFDIRNFSAHRYYLGLKENRGVALLKDLIKKLLEEAATLLRQHPGDHLLNHTGDGFVIVVRGANSAIKALVWISRFREFAASSIKAYDAAFEERFPELHADLMALDFGIGAHTGRIHPFHFQSILSQAEGFLGTAVNVASRVEQCTKDFGHRVICTKQVWSNAINAAAPRRTQINRYATTLGTQRLRGFPKPYELMSLKIGLHKVIAFRKRSSS